MYPIVLLLMVLAVSGIHLFFVKRGRDNKKVVEIFLMYFLVIFVGVSGFLGFIGHVFFSNRIASAIGWPSGSPFQFEVGMADLAFGVLGVMCIWFRRHFWTAVGVGSSIFFLGAAYGHAKHILVYKDTAVYNAGPVFYVGDILVPLIVLSLIIAFNVMEE
jgi:hypothetical protein